MTASPLMSLGMKAMAASYAGLQVTGHNIANASTQGYSRQTVQLTTPEGQFTGAGFFGRGVDVQSVQRVHDAFLTREAASAASLASMDATRLTQLKRLENVFQTGDLGLGAAVSDLMDAFTDLASRPGDLSTRQVVLARARDLADRFDSAGQQLDQLQAGVGAELKVAVDRLNGLGKSIAEANQRIAEMRGLGQPANDLLDQRDRLVAELSTVAKVSTMEAGDGTLSVFIGGGQRLVLGSESAQLQLMQDPADPSRFAVGMKEGGSGRALGESSLGGGAIAGLLRFQNQDLVDARNLVGQLAASVAGAVNAQQTAGLNLQPPAGSVPSQPLFAAGAPRVQPHSANLRDVGGGFTGSVSLEVADASALEASDYSLAETTPGSGDWVLTRLRDGVQRPVGDGDVIDGMRIVFGSPMPQPGDTYLLQPVARAANGFAAVLDDPLDLAAASPLVASPSPANVGTAGVARFAMNGAPPAADGTATISFIGDGGDYSWELRDSGGALLGSGSGVWTPGGSIPPAGVDINGFTLQLSGVPRDGDTLTVAPTAPGAVASNNGNASALLALRDAGITGGRPPADAWGNAMADIGVRVQSAGSSATLSQGMAATTEQQRASKSGVNLDEEAARLIQWQQSYQAAAKVLQVAQQLFAELLQVAGN